MRKRLWWNLLSIILLTATAVAIDLPQGPNIHLKNYRRELKVHLGLDLQGGSRLVYQVSQPPSAKATDGESNLSKRDLSAAMEGLRQVIERRVNALGVGESVVQLATIDNQPSLIVELPGLKDVEQAKRVVGKTALLEFYEPFDSPEFAQGKLDQATVDKLNTGELLFGGNGFYKPTGLSGKHLSTAEVSIAGDNSQQVLQAGQYQVQLTFNSEGSRLLQQITARLIGQPMAIVIDKEIISAPTVQSEIPNGEAIVSGDFTFAKARELATELKSGSLPIPITLAEERTIGPTLGRASIEQALVAALVAVLLVTIFMISYYRLYGVIAIISLGLYTLYTLALFKLIPVTLTLAGIAGLVLSVGAAVDANILVFERAKEERARGLSEALALDRGFARAWNSIRDSNMASLLTAGILFWLGTGIVKGFALTLAVGILVSMFTAVTVSRTLLRIITNFK
ncbi:protein translocase subunit SecD [Candidatus Berkelbacteria bacterium]|nr:protein translocase subunit SecD [Candidatus Berkelbacteria bacterium]